jgi:CxxC-x17-CxxC domain-containing protein
MSDTYEIVCSKCGQEDEIPIDPGEKSAVYCRDCYKEAVREKQEREQSSPRKKHGTRVNLNIECAECGQEADLDYVPKGVPLDEVVCEECFESEAEGTRWEEVKRIKNQERTDEWVFECSECGREDVLNFEPEPNKDYQCTRCFYEHEEPDRERMENKEAAGPGVFIRRGDD